MYKLRVLFIFVTAIAMLMTGCMGSSSTYKQTSVTGTVQLESQSRKMPLSGALVSIANNRVVTNANGTFRIEGIQQGQNTIEVHTDKLSDEPIRIWSKTVDIKAGSNVIDISAKPLGAVVKFSTSRWQLAFYATPTNNARIVKASVITPSGAKHQMEEHFGSSWHTWWNISTPEYGSYQYTVHFSDNTVTDAYLSIPRTAFEADQPNLVSPANYETISTTTPLLKFEADTNADKIYVRIREEGQSNDIWLESTSTSAFQVPNGLLERGKTYAWAVQTVKSAYPALWVEAKSFVRHFKVSE